MTQEARVYGIIGGYNWIYVHNNVIKTILTLCWIPHVAQVQMDSKNNNNNIVENNNNNNDDTADEENN